MDSVLAKKFMTYTLRVKDLEEGNNIQNTVPDAEASIIFSDLLKDQLMESRVENYEMKKITLPERAKTSRQKISSLVMKPLRTTRDYQTITVESLRTKRFKEQSRKRERKNSEEGDFAKYSKYTIKNPFRRERHED